MEVMQQTVTAPAVREDAIRLARSQFFGGARPDAGLSPLIVESWLRCRERGMEPDGRSDVDNAGRLQLAEARECNRGLLDYASGSWSMCSSRSVPRAAW
jgi:hypothetical protein